MDEFQVIAVSVAALIRSVVAAIQLGLNIADRIRRKRENPPDCGSQTDKRIG